MASIQLDRVWINLGSDLTNRITCFSNEGGFDEDDSVFVQVRNYAAGRSRSISRPGSQRTVSCTLKELSSTQVAWLKLYRGKLVLVRDITGRKIWGTYASIKPQMYDLERYYSVNLVVTEITYTEGIV